MAALGKSSKLDTRLLKAPTEDLTQVLNAALAESSESARVQKATQPAAQAWAAQSQVQTQAVQDQWLTHLANHMLIDTRRVAINHDVDTFTAWSATVNHNATQPRQTVGQISAAVISALCYIDAISGGKLPASVDPHHFKFIGSFVEDACHTVGTGSNNIKPENAWHAAEMERLIGRQPDQDGYTASIIYEALRMVSAERDKAQQNLVHTNKLLEHERAAVQQHLQLQKDHLHREEEQDQELQRERERYKKLHVRAAPLDQLMRDNHAQQLEIDNLKESLQSMEGIQRQSEVVARQGSKITRLETEISALQDQLDGADRLQEDLNKKTAELERLDTKHSRLKEDSVKMTTRLNELIKDNHALVSTKQTTEDALSEVQGDLEDETTGHKQTRDALENSKSTIDTLEKKIMALKKAAAWDFDQLTAAKIKIMDLEAAELTYKADQDTAEKNAQASARSIKDLEDANHALEMFKDTLQKRLTALEAANTELNAHTRVQDIAIAAQKETIQENQTVMASGTEQISGLTEELSSCRRILHNRQDAQTRIDQVIRHAIRSRNERISSLLGLFAAETLRRINAEASSRELHLVNKELTQTLSDVANHRQKLNDRIGAQTRIENMLLGAVRSRNHKISLLMQVFGEEALRRINTETYAQQSREDHQNSLITRDLSHAQMLGQLRDQLQQEHADQSAKMRQDFEAQHSADVWFIHHEHDELVEKLTAGTEEQNQSINRLNQEKEAIMADHARQAAQSKQEMEEANATHVEEVSKLNANHADRIKSKNDELEKINLAHASKISEMNEEKEKLRADHGAELKTKDEGLEKLNSARIAAVNRKDQEMEGLRAKHTEEIKEAKQDMEKLKANHLQEENRSKEEIKNIKANHAKDAEQVRLQHAEKVDYLIEESKALKLSKTDQLFSHKEKVENLIAAQVSEVARITGNHQRAIEKHLAQTATIERTLKANADESLLSQRDQITRQFKAQAKALLIAIESRHIADKESTHARYAAMLKRLVLAMKYQDQLATKAKSVEVHTRFEQRLVNLSALICQAVCFTPPVKPGFTFWSLLGRFQRVYECEAPFGSPLQPNLVEVNFQISSRVPVKDGLSSVVRFVACEFSQADALAAVEL